MGHRCVSLPDDDYFIDSNRVLTERRTIAGQQVVVHYDDVPDEDITTVRGIPCTTALRTVIDIGPDCEPGQLERMVADCLRRRLFTVGDAWQRLAQPDMWSLVGARALAAMLRSKCGEP